jgi:hypothetical protein
MPVQQREEDEGGEEEVTPRSCERAQFDPGFCLLSEPSAFAGRRLFAVQNERVSSKVLDKLAHMLTFII